MIAPLYTIELEGIKMKKIDIVITVIVLSVFIFGLMYFTKDDSVSYRDVKFEIASLAILSTVSLFTYFGIRRNLNH
jgi:hypothetical protein